MGATNDYSDEVRQALQAAKKTAIVLGKGPVPAYGNAIAVEGRELLNGIYQIAPESVMVSLKPLLTERNIHPSALPWVNVDGVPDSALEGKRFRVVSPKTENYVSKARKEAKDGVVEIGHLLKVILSELDDSLESLLKYRSHYERIRNHLRDHIIGQDACIESLVHGLKVSRLRINHDKPFSFALLGPTGVGKTEMVKQLARFLFGKDEKKYFISINLSRYQMDTANELIFGGSPYKGQPEEGLLFPFLKQISTRIEGAGADFDLDQQCIILLDEMEKAHPSTYMSFLRLLDEGIIETIHNQKHYRFHLSSRALVFLTSNCGSALYDDDTIGSRFLQNQQMIKQVLQQESILSGTNSSILQRDGHSGGTYGFRPEFLSRIDLFMMFSKLQPSHMELIADLNLREMAQRIRSHESFSHIESIDYDTAIKTLLALSDGFQFGVRNLMTLVETTFVPPLITHADEGSLSDIRHIRVELQDEEFRNAMCPDSSEVRVLAIDDPEDLVKSEDYRNHFNDLGFSWDPASSVQEALDLLKHNNYAFVLMDLDLKILTQIRRRFPSMSVFIFSDEALEIEVNRVLKAGGARDFLRKDLDEMVIQGHLRVFNQLAADQKRLASMKVFMAGKANGFSFEVAPIQRHQDTLLLTLRNVHPTYTPKTDDLGLYTQQLPNVSLSEVQGIDYIRHHVEELIDILKKPLSYLAIGARLPKGVLLFGPPGTGKTMLAQAIAHETSLPFLCTSAGALANRYATHGDAAFSAFFAQAKRNAPCVVFIDEIDGIGQVRSGLNSSTLLQSLLVGMDSIRPHEPVLFVAATNRPEILDPALTRPGRFDRKLCMAHPSSAGREAILRKLIENYDTNNLDIHLIAQLTFGFTGAQLESLLNEAALCAKRRGEGSISMEVLEETIDLVKFGPETEALVHPGDRKQVAIHELGHGIVTLALGTDPLYRVSLISRSSYLGMNEILPQEDSCRKHRTYWLNRIAACMGGRIAEELVFGPKEGMTQGAENDIEMATRIADLMVCQWGMVPHLKGKLVVSERDYLGQETRRDFFYSGSTAQEIDKSMQGLLAEAEGVASDVLKQCQEKIPVWADILVEKEEMASEFLADLMGLNVAQS